ncbi:Hypothetical predicted protein [Mytilus galloprovincialis]|uniref:Farnesoic acid O-methyl transferase domain-containing protein n=1 Tax=Mytilus galloprovincialis TaxID=29158 RepID=A0A8B6FLR0_MYTGA|nr:Hypothetical predicted protein [Mytilus galloprovincialis]
MTVPKDVLFFEVKTCWNAYVGLISGHIDSDPLYEIALGSYQNTKSFIRKGKTSSRFLSEVAGAVFDCTYKEIWITWNTFTINVGFGDGDNGTFLTWTSLTPLLPILDIGIRTYYYQSTGDWIFQIQDETSTTEGITTDGTTTKVTTTKGQSTAGQTTEGTTTEDKTTPGRTTNVTTTEDQTTEAQTPEGRTTESTTTDGTISEGTTIEGLTIDSTTNEGQAIEDTTTEGQTTEGQTSEGKTTEGTTTEGRTTISTTTEGQTNDGTATEDTPAEGTTSDGTNTYGQSTEGTRTEGTRTEVSITEGTTADSSTTDFQITKPSDHISPPTSSAKSLAEAILCTEYCTISYTCKCEESLGTTTSSTPVTQYKVDKKTLSSYKRRYQSASDPRKSSFYIGCVGITVLVVSCAFVVTLDFVPRA